MFYTSCVCNISAILPQFIGRNLDKDYTVVNVKIKDFIVEHHRKDVLKKYSTYFNINCDTECVGENFQDGEHHGFGLSRLQGNIYYLCFIYLHNDLIKLLFQSYTRDWHIFNYVTPCTVRNVYSIKVTTPLFKVIALVRWLVTCILHTFGKQGIIIYFKPLSAN